MSGLLSGCAAVVVAGGATTAVVLQDRRPLAMQVDDEGRERELATRLREAGAERLNAEVASYNGVVLLTGKARDEDARHQAETTARSLPGVRRVINEIRMVPADELLGGQTEPWLTARVRTHLINARELDSGRIRIVTDNGAVYLFGIVTRAQGDLATEAARTVEGVNRVVKLFEYIE